MQEPIKSNALQEDLLILLCFSNEHCRIIRGVLEPEHFDPIYARIVDRVFRYIDKYKDAPKDGLPTIIDDLINSEDKYVAKVANRTLADLFANKDSVNARYALDRLASFVREHKLKSAILDAAAILQNADTADDESLDEAERILGVAMRDRLAMFDPGTFLTDTKRSFKFLHHDQTDCLPTAIRELDKRSAGPVKGGLHLFIAPPKHGKSWWLVHLGRAALLQRLNVVHVTLEMDEARVAGRYLQSLFSISKREMTKTVTRFELDENGRFIGMFGVELNNKLNLTMPDIETRLLSKIHRLGPRLKGLVIKQFPTGMLTIRALTSYLDMLADKDGLRPDLLIVDYADLMRVETRDYRISLGQLYKELRGLAVERGFAVATATQGNRASLDPKGGLVTESHVAEDFSKVATSDIVLTYARTATEKMHGLARVYVAAGRNDEDKFSVLLSQNYDIGKFAIDSWFMHPSYNSVLDNAGANSQNEGSNED